MINKNKVNTFKIWYVLVKYDLSQCHTNENPTLTTRTLNSF